MMMQMGRGGAGGRGGPQGMGMMPGGTPDQGQGQPEPVAPSTNYLTLHPGLKLILDQVEAKGNLLSVATDNSRAIKGVVSGLLANTELSATEKALVDPVLRTDPIVTLGSSFHMREGISVTVAAELRAEDVAKVTFGVVQRGQPQLAKLLGEKTGLTFDVPGEQQPGGPGGMPGFQGMNPSGPGTPGAMMGPMGGRPRMGTGGSGTSIGAGEPRGAPQFPGTPGTPTFPGTPGGEQPLTEPPQPKSTLASNLDGKVVVVTANFALDGKAHETLMTEHVRPQVVKRKGAMDMAAASPSRVHDLAQALMAYRDSQKGLPRGTFDRPLPTSRAGRPYAPNERVSWMADLLPFLGLSDLHGRIDFKKSWKDKDNLGAATTLVPQFLDPRTPTSSWWYRYPGLNVEVATTQFVALAGVGIDAANFRADDPAVQTKLGAFGYDRVTRLADLKDRTSHTALVVQAPSTVRRPWLAGGGATVQGVAPTRSIQPFVSTQHNGKRGTLMVMADGSVRFVNENVSDDVFKAMVTIRGSDDVTFSKDDPIVPPPEGQPELRTEPAAPTTPTPTAPTTAPATPAAWKEFSPPGGNFTVSFPGTPAEVKQSITTPAGNVAVNLYVVANAAEQSQYVAGYSDLLPEIAQKLKPEQILDTVRQEVVMKLPGTKILEEKPIALDGAPGRDLTFDAGAAGQGRFRFYLVGSRLFRVGVAGPAAKLTSPEAEKFMASFRIQAK
jgi:hypothetical protein